MQGPLLTCRMLYSTLQSTSSRHPQQYALCHRIESAQPPSTSTYTYACPSEGRHTHTHTHTIVVSAPDPPPWHINTSEPDQHLHKVQSANYILEIGETQPKWLHLVSSAQVSYNYKQRKFPSYIHNRIIIHLTPHLILLSIYSTKLHF